MKPERPGVFHGSPGCRCVGARAAGCVRRFGVGPKRAIGGLLARDGSSHRRTPRTGGPECAGRGIPADGREGVDDVVEDGAWKPP